MKQGNQFYLTIQLEDVNGSLLDIHTIKKVQFVIGDIIKTYDSVSEEVTYDKDKNCFKIWLKEEETFNFDKVIKMDARILFRDDCIGGTYIESKYWYDSLGKELLSTND